VLHYYFAKLQLHSLAVRGVTPPQLSAESSQSSYLSTERTEAANVAVFSAMSALRMVLNEPDIREGIIGVPLFKHTMMTFAAVFLLRVAWKWNAFLNINTNQVLTLVQAIVDLMRSVQVNKRHLVWRLANGLADNLTKLKEALATQSDTSPPSHAAGVHGNTNTMHRRQTPRAPLQIDAGQQQWQQQQIFSDTQTRDIFDDMFMADGLSFAADEWLFTAPYENSMSYDQNEIPENDTWNRMPQNQYR